MIAGYFVYESSSIGLTCARYPIWNSTDMHGKPKPHVGERYELTDEEMKMPLKELERKYRKPEVAL